MYLPISIADPKGPLPAQNRRTCGFVARLGILNTVFYPCGRDLIQEKILVFPLRLALFTCFALLVLAPPALTRPELPPNEWQTGVNEIMAGKPDQAAITAFAGKAPDRCLPAKASGPTLSMEPRQAPYGLAPSGPCAGNPRAWIIDLSHPQRRERLPHESARRPTAEFQSPQV